MTIGWAAFTPWAALAGGAITGIAGIDRARMRAVASPKAAAASARE